MAHTLTKSDAVRNLCLESLGGYEIMKSYSHVAT
jgi:hypothetical protein